MITVQATTFAEAKEDYRRYTEALRLVDTYWEDLIVDGEVYRIEVDGRRAGFCTLYAQPDREEYGFLTSFYLYPEMLRYAKAAFHILLEQFRPRGAYVVSGDEVLLSLCAERQKKLLMQAYFFDYRPQEPLQPAAYPAEQVRLATEADVDDLTASGFYHSVALDDPENRLYVLRDEAGEYLGTGHIARLALDRSYGAVGMCTAPAHRQKGVGRSIILALTRIVLQEGLTPIAGCNWYNHASRATLESCGFSSTTRFLKFIF